MKKLAKYLLLIVLLVLFITGYTHAADNDSHTVTVTVSAINELAITGGNVTLTINSATAGSQPDDAVDNTTADLDWTTNESSKKITIVSDLSAAAQNFTLLAVAQNVTGGTAASQVTVDNSADDFVTGVATTVGGCDIQYTGQATVSQGTGSDVHTITFTLTDSA
jgi:hypothetical protein